MYIILTERCNMKCPHCCNSCGPRGKDMSWDTFVKAMEYCKDEYITLGGGEPTLHPMFWQMFGYALGTAEDIFIITNGKITEIALRLARLARRGIIGCDLSRDRYHEDIEPFVVKAFTKVSGGFMDEHEKENDRRGIRNTTAGGREAIYQGRAKVTQVAAYDSVACLCDSYQFHPDGNIYACGCTNAPLIGKIGEADLPDRDEAGYDSHAWQTKKWKDAEKNYRENLR